MDRLLELPSVTISDTESGLFAVVTKAYDGCGLIYRRDGQTEVAPTFELAKQRVYHENALVKLKQFYKSRGKNE